MQINPPKKQIYAHGIAIVALVVTLAYRAEKGIINFSDFLSYLFLSTFLTIILMTIVGLIVDLLVGNEKIDSVVISITTSICVTIICIGVFLLDFILKVQMFLRNLLGLIPP